MTDVEPLRAQAGQFVDTGDIFAAQKIFHQIIAIKHDDLNAHYMLGVLFAEQGNIDVAVGFLQKAITLDPTHPDSYFVLARIHQSKNEFQEALAYCLKAVELDPDFEDAWLLLCGLSGKLGKYDTVHTSCQKTLLFSPGSFVAQFYFANALFVEKKYEEAAKHYEIAVDLDPSHAEVWQVLVHSLYNCKKLADAKNHAVEALKKFPSDLLIHNLLSAIFIDTGFFDKAEKQLKKALTLGDDNIETLMVLGNFYQRKHEHRKALEAYQKALTLSPHTAQIYFNMGCSYLELEDYIHAVEYLKKTIDLKQGIPEAKHILAVAEGKNPGDRPDNEHLKSVFDDYAERYDDSQKELQYNVPKLITTAIRETITKFGINNKLDILELGCGTGLCAPFIQDLCMTFTGVDLAPKMIKAASKLNIYSELILSDMNEFMRNKPLHYDIIFAADVFIYFGELTKDFESAWSALKQNGFFIFNVEVNDDAIQYKLSKRGRYKHAKPYIPELSKQNGFIEISHEEIISRADLGIPVKSIIYILQKKTRQD